jgi:small subunit ribosomal protein S3
MGQKINPKIFRLGGVYSWSSRWFSNDRRYGEFLLEDAKLREYLGRKLKMAGFLEVEIERSINKMKLIIHVSKPGIVIGRGGSGLEDMKRAIERFLINFRNVRQKNAASRFWKESGKLKVEIVVEPVKEPNLSAQLVAISVSDQLVRRIPPKRACNQAMERVMNAGALGVKILLAGRINGAEIARREKFSAGSIPLSTIREEVDFAISPALTKSGYIGVKVWICKKKAK